jgi:tetratricopeptide (TPR) repeat protein
VLAIARNDQVIELNTNRSYNLDCDDALGEGAFQCLGNVPYHAPAVRTWEELLYSAFAQRFVLTADPAAYPRWYLDGVGALFSTVRVRGNGAIDYALPPEQYKQVLRSYGDMNVGDVLSGRYLDAANKKTSWSPYHAWLLAHYFLFSNLKPERSKQFLDYMTAIHRGVPMAEAARVFGDMGKLQRDVAKYAAAQKSFARADPPQAPLADPIVTALSPGSAALVEARIELGTRLAPGEAQAGAAAPTQALAPSDAQRRDGWLARVRDTVARLPYDSEALLFAAEAECRSGHDGDCLGDAERVLARSPDNARALAWKGVALTGQAVTGPATNRAATLAAARRTIERAIELDGDAPLPLIAYFQSFARAGERVPDPAMLGMAKVIRSVPAAPAPRLYLAEELLRQGKADLARRVVYTVLYGAYDSPEKTAAQALFASAAGPPPTGR